MAPMAKKNDKATGQKLLIAFGALFALQGLAYFTLGRKRA
jgi:hypothetical protein